MECNRVHEGFLKNHEGFMKAFMKAFTGVHEGYEGFFCIIYYILYCFSFFYITFLSFWFFVKSFCVTIEYIDKRKSLHKYSCQEKTLHQTLHKVFIKTQKAFIKTPKIPPFYSKMIFLHKTYLYY